MAGYNTWGTSWGASWGVSWGAAQPIIVVGDTHDGADKERTKRFRKDRDELKADLQSAINRVLGIVPDDPVEIVKTVRRALPQFKAKERPKLREMATALDKLNRIVDEQQAAMRAEAEDEEFILMNML